MNVIKTILLHIFIIGVSNGVSAQQERGFKNSLQINSRTNNISLLSVAVNYCIQKNHHQFFIGPNFPVSQINEEGIGLNAGYIFYPNSVPQPVDFFFHYDFQMHSENGIRLNGSNLEIGKGIAFYNNLGYGFHVNILQRFCITHSLGLGLKNFRIKNGDSTYELVGILKLGLGYKF